MGKVCFFNKLFGKIGSTFGVLCLHCHTPTDRSVRSVKTSSDALAGMYFNCTGPVNEFKVSFGSNEKKRYSKEILGDYVYNFGVERYFVKILKR